LLGNGGEKRKKTGEKLKCAGPPRDWGFSHYDTATEEEKAGGGTFVTLTRRALNKEPSNASRGGKEDLTKGAWGSGVWGACKGGVFSQCCSNKKGETGLLREPKISATGGERERGGGKGALE